VPSWGVRGRRVEPCPIDGYFNNHTIERGKAQVTRELLGADKIEALRAQSIQV
jgi:hypothetical protein